MELSMLMTYAGQPYLSLFFRDFRINGLMTYGAKTPGFFYQHYKSTRSIIVLLSRVRVTLMLVSAVYYRYWSATLLVLSCS
jgi:hypothetical protein